MQKTELGFLDESICAKCGGTCCNQMPGAAFPSDFTVDGQVSFKMIRELILSKHWVFDYWEGDPTGGEASQAYFIRPAVKDATRWPVDASWGGKCVFQTKKGCKLRFEGRPKECRMLEPGVGSCDKHGCSKREAAIDWMPYTTEIEAIIKEAREKDD